MNINNVIPCFNYSSIRVESDLEYLGHDEESNTHNFNGPITHELAAKMIGVEEFPSYIVTENELNQNEFKDRCKHVRHFLGTCLSHNIDPVTDLEAAKTNYYAENSSDVMNDTIHNITSVKNA